MNLLALETSAETASVALMLGSEIIIREGGSPGTHARFVLPWVRELLAQGGLNLGQLDAVAFSSGPGSFTGLRLSVSVAQGLALGADLPVVDVPTLEALALACGDGMHLCCVDARMSEVYSGRFAVSGSHVVARSALTVSDPSVLPVPDGALSAWQGCGSGFALEPVLALPWVSSLRAVRASVSAHAREVARLGQVRLDQGLGQDAALAAPLYVRDKVAQTTAERLASGGRA